LDYCKIGQRIRKLRREAELSQEALAERVNISTTHMSHIETGNTKLSLSVFVDIANALNVRTDVLLDGVTFENGNRVLAEEVAAVLDSCTPEEANVIVDIVKATKRSMDKNL